MQNAHAAYSFDSDSVTVYPLSIIIWALSAQ